MLLIPRNCCKGDCNSQYFPSYLCRKVTLQFNFYNTEKMINENSMIYASIFYITKCLAFNRPKSILFYLNLKLQTKKWNQIKLLQKVFFLHIEWKKNPSNMLSDSYKNTGKSWGVQIVLMQILNAIKGDRLGYFTLEPQNEMYNCSQKCIGILALIYIFIQCVSKMNAITPLLWCEWYFILLARWRNHIWIH